MREELTNNKLRLSATKGTRGNRDILGWVKVIEHETGKAAAGLPCISCKEPPFPKLASTVR
jgi:hypothetical protein